MGRALPSSQCCQKPHRAQLHPCPTLGMAATLREGLINSVYRRRRRGQCSCTGHSWACGLWAQLLDDSSFWAPVARHGLCGVRAWMGWHCLAQRAQAASPAGQPLGWDGPITARSKVLPGACGHSHGQGWSPPGWGRSCQGSWGQLSGGPCCHCSLREKLCHGASPSSGEPFQR